MFAPLFSVLSILCAIQLYQCFYLSYPTTVISLDIPHYPPPSNSNRPNSDGNIHDSSSAESVDTETINNGVTQGVTTESCHKCVCGVVNRKTRIVGGVVADQHEFPWMVALSKRGKFYCGATIITRNHLLTAAHCVDGFSAKEIKATIGEYNRTMKNDTKRQIIRIKEIIRHPNFQISNFKNDIAILKVETEMKFATPYIQPACLPAYENRNYTGIMATVTGWGRTGEYSGTSNEVRKVEVPIMSLDECRQNSGYVPTRITDNMMCAGYIEGQKDSCQGDSGGPLQIAGSKAGTMEVVGIVSWGRGCARPNFPGVYTKISNYIDWVDSNIDNECTCKG